MKIGIISDIHGNIEALNKAMESLKDKMVDTIVCLGDLVGYGCNPNEVIEKIRKEKIMCLKGNYDASVVDGCYSYIRDTEINKFALPWAIKNVTEENKNFLKSLPESLILSFNEVTLRFVHGSPRKINEYLFENSNEVQDVMEELKEEVLICAHTHIPYKRNINGKMIINDGSIGKPKIGRPNLTYAILEVDGEGISYEYIEEEYDYNLVIKKMQKLNYPEKLIDSYTTGIE